MSNMVIRIRNGFFGLFILLLGVAAGESMLPQNAVASNCAYEKCVAGASGDYCETSVNATNCDWGIETCSTAECSGGGDDDPGPVE